MITVPCNVVVKRFYRSCVTVPDGATDEQIIEAIKKEIVEYQDNMLDDPDGLDIEEYDILSVEIDHDAEWTDGEE